MDVTIDSVAKAALQVPPVNLSQKREQIAGPSGLKGLTSNKKTFLIGLFASLGGLVYGCEYSYIQEKQIEIV
jgi:hypothetical protein